ncbi:hypothetical protein MMIC_P0801 [Mariprofundus micogutta]|uniref:TMEM205-like domain-containing protein n=1 Tax=Mariprofundus micogutta TaxID=1921010 RepID=A0A1L8CLR4_9PROT|nr:DUF4149 domain-containing protein [Mariprofundus micogutta]GAV19843.1 hypothetical protein MMIC_P0801 [Mariprofundus micogutta]
MRVDCIRMGSVRLCLALMLGLLVVPGYVVAPVLFAKAGSVSLAGSLAGDIFHLANMAIIFLAAAVLVFWLRMQKSGALIGRLRWILLLLLAALIMGNEFAVSPVLADLKAQLGPMDQVADDNPQRKLFGMWHGISALIHLVAAISAAALVALGGRAPSKDTCPS